MKYPKTKEILNQAVADLSQLSMIVHQQHWYMRGPGFLKLHPYLDDVMDELNDQVDLVAERLVTLDGSPYSTLKEMVDNSKIPAQKANWTDSTPTRFARIIEGYRYLEKLYQEGIEASAAEGDDSSNDLFISNKTALEKRIWMMQAELGKAPNIDN